MEKGSNELLEEFKFCISMWQKQGYCEFGGKTKCKECGSLYVLYKLLTGEILHGDMERLALEDWKDKLNKVEELKQYFE